uniref:CUB domain-containing protein n=1 Tax=Graphocephala atropunctata TaxID=36148 RepID=A0A1B6LLD3_9HEMI
MFHVALCVAALVCCAAARKSGGGGGSTFAQGLDTIDYSCRDMYCDQPLFMNFAPKTEEIQLVDNSCLTFFPLPDDPNTFQVYISRVFCDGSSDVTSFITTDIERGVSRDANPFVTRTYVVFGYAGCDTHLLLGYDTFGDSGEPDPYVFGLSPNCRPLGLSCLRKVEEIVGSSCLPELDYYVLPQKLPNRCVTQQICINPTANNQFYKGIGLSRPLHHL